MSERAAYFLKEAYKCNLGLFTRKCFFALNASEEYYHNWHIDAIAEYLTACKKRQIRRLIINMPPRSLKSICTTIAFPAWLLGHDPSLKIMAASYSQALSHKHSMDTRHIMLTDWHLYPKIT